MSRQTTSSHFHRSRTLDNKYILGDEIGKGAYGRVYRGLDLENGDFVAIKQVSLENIAQEDLNIIMQEIDLLKNLNHKNIVKYLGSLKTKSHLHIILEYMENGSLANIIKPTKFGPFPESLVAVYIAQVLEGLVYLHEQGVIHRDIKGANILTNKEGLVKLADFGVATKLTEADVNTHSVVGTPYWMAPEVIEMSGVWAASDIWSVGCTVIELLTCVPPYYDLQPMPALFRIVQDETPPIPDSLSPETTNFLQQCFKKDARQRPDAKTLLSHPWIQKCRRALQPSLRHSGALSNIQEAASMGDSICNDNDLNTDEILAAGKVQIDSHDIESVSRKTFPRGVDFSDTIKDQSYSCMHVVGGDNPEEDGLLDRVLTLSIHDKPCIKTSSGKLLADIEVSSGSRSTVLDRPQNDNECSMSNDVGSPESIKEHEKNGSESRLFSFKARNPDDSSLKASKASGISGANELSRFSDSPGDASLDDLFHPLDKSLNDRITEASTSASTSHANQGEPVPADVATHDLASKLRATIAQKQLENETGQKSGGNLLRLMMGILKEDVIDIDGLVFDEKLPGESLFPLQAVEFSRLVGLLRLGETEDVIESSCQKLLAFFHRRPEQKTVFVTQHGFLPLKELLGVPQNRVICSVLQIVNEIIKDNTDFQENACLVGLIPVLMSFAVPDCPPEIRMESAYFFQQLCQSSSLTLHMFIACGGIPVLVGFLEADYAKYREMVHLAIDCMWQVFKLQCSTPRNDFCRIAAKNGILIRLINTLYSLNEATRLASLSCANKIPLDGSTQPPRSVPLDSSQPSVVPNEATQLDLPILRHGSNDLSQKLDPKQSDSKSSGVLKLLDSISIEKTSNGSGKEFLPSTFKERENLDRGKGELSNLEVEHRHERGSNVNRTSIDRIPRSLESLPNGFPPQEQVRPLLSLLQKEPPTRHFSGQLEYVRHLSGLEKHETVVLNGSHEKKTNGELDFLMAEFADVSGRGNGNGNIDLALLNNSKSINKKFVPTTSSVEGATSQTASGVLSGSGVLSAARPGSATSSGLLSNMVSTLNADVAREYLGKVSDLLLQFAQADTTVKSYMCSVSLLSRLFQMFNKIEPQILLKLLKCINHLSTDPNCLENLQRADAIKYLIPNIELKEGPLISQIHNEVLNALFNLCKINKRRQEQAAENGIIPHLMNFIMSGSVLRQYALPLLCDMAHASRNSREQLRAHGGLDVYLSLLDDEVWSVTALDSIAVCLAHDNEDSHRVEQALVKKDAVQKLVKFFQHCPDQHFVHILDPFLKIITKSSRISTTLAVNGLTALLIQRLHHQDAIARLNLLKLIKAVYEHHPRPKQLIVENDLPHKLQTLIEERRDGQRSGGQVLVKQMATSLLKALHINTVL